jgi:hypothetical protein
MFTGNVRVKLQRNCYVYRVRERIGAAALSTQAVSSTLKMEATGLSETLVPTYQTTRCHHPKDLNQNFHHGETHLIQ